MKKEIFEAEIGGKLLKIQLGELADQASGCVLAQFGDTAVLCTAQIGEEKPDMGYFPLTCEYQERFYAAGKILGSRFIRREGRPPTGSVLNSRVIDRAIRPLFPKGITNEIQVIATCLSWDAKNDPGILALNGVSLALGLSDIPWAGPVGVVRVGKKDGKFIINPNYEEREAGEFDLVLVGTKSKDKKEILINMIEAKTNESQEKDMLDAYDFAMPFIKQILDFQDKVIKSHGKEKLVINKQGLEPNTEKKIREFLAKKIDKALYQVDKQKMNSGLRVVLEEAMSEFAEELSEKDGDKVENIFEEEIERIFKENILKNDKRPDGRKMDEVRQIDCQVGILPHTHGSGMFTRGQTRVLSILTLGSPGDQQLIESMEVSEKKRFMHHYNFPPYSSGEVGRIGSPGRREIGHGALAEKAIEPLLPDIEKFPYTIRIVSESLSSNGSTSMASVSGACLALMDAGVPIIRPATGIAIGLVIGKTIDEFKLLTDIQGPEDHHGEMDFKVAGTTEGITAIQMDVKTTGINKKIFEQAMQAAKKARLDILAEMKKTIPGPRPELSKYAPRVYSLRINPDKIGAVIGSGGKVINEIIEQCDVQIDIDDDGIVFITSENSEGADKAVKWVKDLTRELEVGEIFNGKVVKIMDFGAFVELVPGQDGLVHISEFVPQRINSVEDVVKEGEIIPVKIIKIDEQGKISLSAKAAGFTSKIKPKSANLTGGEPRRGFKPKQRRGR